MIDRSLLPESCVCIDGDELPDGIENGFFAFFHPTGRLKRLAHYRDGQIDRQDDVLELAQDKEEGICYKPFLNIISRYRDGREWIERLDAERSEDSDWISLLEARYPQEVAWQSWVKEQIADMVPYAWVRYDASSLPPDHIVIEGDELPANLPDGLVAWLYPGDGQLKKLARAQGGQLDPEEVVLELAQGKKEGTAWIPQWFIRKEYPQATTVESYQRRIFTSRNQTSSVVSEQVAEHPCPWGQWVERSLAFLAHAPFVKIDASYLPEGYMEVPSRQNFLDTRFDREPLYNRRLASFYEGGQLEFYAYVRNSHLYEIQWQLHLVYGQNKGSLEAGGVGQEYERGCFEEDWLYGDGLPSFPVSYPWETWVKESIAKVYART